MVGPAVYFLVRESPALVPTRVLLCRFRARFRQIRNYIGREHGVTLLGPLSNVVSGNILIMRLSPWSAVTFLGEENFVSVYI